MNPNAKNLQPLQILAQIITNPQTHLFSQLLSSHNIEPLPSVLLLLLRHLPSLFTHLLRSLLSLPHPSIPGQCLHSLSLKLGLSSNRFIQTSLIHFYSATGLLTSSHQVFYQMPQRDVVAHNAMILALSSHRLTSYARSLFDSMHIKNSASWNSMVSCYCKQKDIENAREIFDRNPVKNVVSWNGMIDGYCKAGHLEKARELFDRLGSGKDAVTWNTMISGYLHGREFGAALSMFQEMQAANVRPTEFTMVSLLSACAHLGALSMGRWIHAYIQNNKLRFDVVLGNALVDMYFKCGSVEAALEVFRMMRVKNVFCWNSVIAGLGMHGLGEQAIEVFLEMIREGRVCPDGVTFVGLLSGCSHSGLLSEGKKYFSQMASVYCVEPKIEHYGCMVDLLGCAGLLEESLHFVGAMPIKPNHVVWGSLLRSCRIHKDTTVSEKVTKRLLELDPNDAGNYVFLSNVYASVNRWNDVENCRRIMVERGVLKVPGCSSVEVKGVVHEFVAGDVSHPLFGQISIFLLEISMELKKLGYRPSVDSVLYDMEDEEEESMVMSQSE